MITIEREFLKCHERLEKLVETVRKIGDSEVRIDEAERTIFAELLELGRDLLIAFVRNAGDGNVGDTVEVPVCRETVDSDSAEESPS